MTAHKPNPRDILPDWLRRLTLSKSKIKPQPRCTCGRFCSTHDDVPDVKSKLVAELSAQGAYVPARFAKKAQEQGRGN